MAESRSEDKPQPQTREESEAEWEAVLNSDLDDENLCEVCGGDGVIMAADGDGSDWGEDTYCGPMDAVIPCRHCNGGIRK